jgi:hypothetical protein
MKTHPNTPQTILRWVFVLSIGLAPITLFAYTIFAPFLRGDGQAAIAANIAASPVTNQLHLAFGVAAGLLLPIAFLGLAVLAMKRSPGWATAGGILGLFGWLPWSALMAQEALTADMAKLGGGSQFAQLWDTFNADGVMLFFILFYIICHLLSAIFLGIALIRAHAVPRWSAWALILTSPLSVIAFPTHQLGLLYVVNILFIAAMIPAALAMVRNSNKSLG